MHAMSPVRNTQSRAQDALTQQQRNGKQTPDVSDSSRTVHAVLSNNNRTVHTVLTKNNTHVDAAGKNRDTLKHSLKHHESPPENTRTKHVNLRTPPRREYHVLFAEFSSQGGRSTSTSLQSPFPSPHATFLVLAWEAVVRDLWRTPVVRYSLSHHLCALFDVCFQALDCASALNRVCRFSNHCTCSRPHAKPAS